MVLHSFYSPHERVILDCGDELITKQSHKDECDINTILSQFSKTGIISHINQSSASFIDLPSNLDFQDAFSLVESAEYAFSTLPSKVRDRYQNDPAQFLSALSTPSERSFLEEVGVFKSPPPPEPGPAPVAKPEAGGAL